jgi:UDP-N-acetylmuramoyl-L-alanyl-D-glutamate--2,6-diaminopimelate ligase
MLRTIFAETGHSVGVIGTLGTYLNDDHIPGARTTPESTDLYALFALMVQRGVTHVFMEVSSHALVLDRVAEVSFDAAVFTNLTQDHLDFHGDMENYFQAKASLFRAGVARQAVICIDDEWGVRLSTSLSIPTLTVGKQGSWKIGKAETSQYGLTKCAVSTPKGNLNLVLNMFGSFNVTNATLAIATADLLGVDSSNAALALEKLAAIPGRFEIVKHSAVGTAVVDYAHTPDAVATVLKVINESNPSKIITVIGCGGDRDASKRPLMGEAAAKLSDLVIVTDDNPRSEIPADIRSAVVGGTVGGKAEVVEIADRREAIRFALSQASDGDVIAVLGKGHESGQEINGEILPFDDREVIVAEASRV